jgi:DNA-binding HxlR family transcriptional regulator
MPPRRRRPSLDPLHEALADVGDRWTLLVVHALLGGPRRFNELQEELGGIAPNVLSQRLRRLEQTRLVLAEPYSERPPRYAYQLTPTGAELAGALRLLTQWGADRDDRPVPSAHRACGSSPEARWWCRTCDRVIDEDELERGDEDVRWV